MGKSFGAIDQQRSVGGGYQSAGVEWRFADGGRERATGTVWRFGDAGVCDGGPSTFASTDGSGYATFTLWAKNMVVPSGTARSLSCSFIAGSVTKTIPFIGANYVPIGLVIPPTPLD
jgi:hypothetical protein